MNARAGVPPDLEQLFHLTELKTFAASDDPPYALVFHNPGIGLISDFWLGGFGGQEEFRRVLEFIAGQIESGRYRLWLADLRYMSKDFSLSGDWLVTELMPRVLANGLEREAVVLREDSNMPQGYDVFGVATVALRRIADGRVRGFTDLDAAKRWLIKGVVPG